MPLKKKKASVKPKRANTLSSKKHEMVTVEESGKDFLRPITDRSQWEFEENDTQLITKAVAGYVEKLKKGSLKGIRDEFRRNKSYIPEGRKEACVENETKNRYKDVLLLDSSRIKLKDQGCDYIHASKVMVGNNMFICTQGPLAATAAHFWAMVIQENVKLIVMLCRLIEDGKEKSFEYLPRTTGGKKIIGDFSIVCILRTALPELDAVSHSILKVTYKGKTETINHLWYEAWADHMAPDNFLVSLELIHLARKKRSNAPVVVHCSAGVGRTGCFVGIELACYQAATLPVFSMETMLKTLRDQRMHAIQNDVQYLYVNRAMIECLIRKQVIKRIDFLKFINAYDNLIKRKKLKGNPKKTVDSIDDAETALLR